MWVRSPASSEIFTIGAEHVALSTVLKSFEPLTPMQAAKDFFGAEHTGFVQWCHELDQFRNFPWLQWRDPSSIPPTSFQETLQYDTPIQTLRQHFDTIFKPCIVEFPDVHPSILQHIVMPFACCIVLSSCYR